MDLENQVFSGRLSNPETDVVGKNRRWSVLGPGEEDFADAIAGGMVHAVPKWTGGHVRDSLSNFIISLNRRDRLRIGQPLKQVENLSFVLLRKACL